MATLADNTARKHLEPYKWQPGVSPNPSGRPKGSRNKLGEAFIDALKDDFEKHGVAALAEVRETKPDQYLKVIAAVIPKEVHHTVDDYDGYSTEQLQADVYELARRIVEAGSNAGGTRPALEDYRREGEVQD